MRLPSHEKLAEGLRCTPKAVGRKLSSLRGKRAILGKGKNVRLADWVIADADSAEFCLLFLDYQGKLGPGHGNKPRDVPTQEYLPYAVRDRRIQAADRAMDRKTAILAIMCHLERIQLLKSRSAQGQHLMNRGKPLARAESYLELLLRSHEAALLGDAKGTPRVRPVQFDKIPA